MGLLSTNWSLKFGQFIVSAVIPSDKLEEAFAVCASSFAVPAHPEGEMKIHAPCGILDPSGVVVGHHVLDGDGNTWVGVGTRTCANTPNPALVEAEFRRRAFDLFGSDWSAVKKGKLSRVRKQAKTFLACQTPFRLSDSGALFVCLQTGQFLAVGKAALEVAKDISLRIEEIGDCVTSEPAPERSNALLAFLRTQEDSGTPWPTGTASLNRLRGDLRESCSARLMSWADGSTDAEALLDQGWHPIKIEIGWDKHFGKIGLTGRLEAITFPGKIEGADPFVEIELRLGQAVAWDQQVQVLIQSFSDQPVLIPNE